MISIGIDPGVTGAIVAIDSESLEVLLCRDTPMITGGEKREYDISTMAGILRSASLGRPTAVILEQVHTIPGQGVASMFSLGRGFGIWQGILGALELPYRTVWARAWTKAVLNGIPGTGKGRSMLFASRTFPRLELVPDGCRRPRDGRADAACLAYYGARVA